MYNGGSDPGRQVIWLPSQLAFHRASPAKAKANAKATAPLSAIVIVNAIAICYLLSAIAGIVWRSGGFIRARISWRGLTVGA